MNNKYLEKIAFAFKPISVNKVTGSVRKLDPGKIVNPFKPKNTVAPVKMPVIKPPQTVKSTINK